MAKITELLVNGAKRRVEADTERTLLSVLRDDLDLTGCKYGCGEGECGACTVLVDGAPRRSCRTPVSTVGTKPITTVEGLETDGRLHPLQQAFLDLDAMQCAYCASGMLMSGVALLKKNPNPSREEIVRAMDGNVCRCGCYPRIIAAVHQAAKAMKGGGK
jgi:aerobic-type carbon monoxide dehydrogenase small subunit (CoxS/CutS family)